MTRWPWAIAVALLVNVGWLDARPSGAEPTTIVGNAGTITIDWGVAEDRAGRPVIVGHIVTYGSKSGYCRPRLLVETLDAEGRPIARHVGFIPGYLGGFDDLYFEEPVRAPGPGYRVSIASWDKCSGGAQ